MMLLLTRSSCFWPLRLQPSACHFVHVHYQPRTKTNLRLWFSRPFSSGSCTVVSAVQSAVVEGTAVVLLFVVDPLSLVTPESTHPQVSPDHRTRLHRAQLHRAQPHRARLHRPPPLRLEPCSAQAALRLTSSPLSRRHHTQHDGPAPKQYKWRATWPTATCHPQTRRQDQVKQLSRPCGGSSQQQRDRPSSNTSFNLKSS